MHEPPAICWIDANNTDRLAHIAPGVFDHDLDPERLQTYLANPHNWLCVALKDDWVVGMVMSVVHHHPDKPTEIYLDEIGTGRDWRRQGIAESLIKALCARAEKAGIDEIWVATESDNWPARALYEKTGARGTQAAIYYYLKW